MTRSRRIAAGVAGTLLFLLVLAVVIVKVVFTKERVLSLLTPQLERVINRPVAIADAGITLWNGIGVRLESVTVGNAPGFTDEPMLGIGTLDIKARFWPLLSGRVVVDRIVIAEPYALVEFDDQGRSNFDNFVKSDATTDSVQGASSSQRITVATVSITDARFSWREKRAGKWIDLYGADAEIDVNAGDFATPRFIAEVLFDSLLVFQESRRLAIRAGRPSLYLDGSWDRSSRTLTLDSTVTEWWGAKLAADGRVRFLPAVKEIAFNARLGSVRVEELIREMRSAFALDRFADLTGSMSGRFEARLVWPLPENTVPDWQGRFELIDVKWPLPQTGTVVTIPRVEIRGGEQSVSWSASAGQITGGTFSSSGTIDQLFIGEKTFSAKVEADMPLEGTRGLFPQESRRSLGGSLHVDLSGFGIVDNWQEMNLNGRVNSDGLTVADADWDFDSVMASLDCHLTGHGLRVSRCEWTAGDSRGTLSGAIENIVPAALSGFTSPDIPHGTLDVVCPFLNLDRIIGEDRALDTAATGTANAEQIPLLSITGNLSADTLIYNGVTIDSAHAPYAYKDRVLSLSPISGSVFGGSLDGRLDWNLNAWPQPEFFTSITASGIESNDFFSRYLGWAGGIYGQMSMSGEFSGKGRMAEQIVPTLLARGRVDLSSTRLESAPLLAKIGQVVGLAGIDRPRSLRDIRLPFRIENGRVITDDVRFTWDDVDYSANGSFGLDQTLSYQVHARANAERAPRVVQGTGLHFIVGGTVTEPAVRIDATGTARGIIDDAVKNATDTLQKALDQKLKDFFTPRKP